MPVLLQKIFPLGPIKGEVIVYNVTDDAATSATVKSLMNNPRLAFATQHMSNSTTNPLTGASIGSVSNRDITVNFGAEANDRRLTIFVIGE